MNKNFNEKGKYNILQRIVGWWNKPVYLSGNQLMVVIYAVVGSIIFLSFVF